MGLVIYSSIFPIIRNDMKGRAAETRAYATRTRPRPQTSNIGSKMSGSGLEKNENIATPDPPNKKRTVVPMKRRRKKGLTSSIRLKILEGHIVLITAMEESTNQQRKKPRLVHTSVKDEAEVSPMRPCGYER